MVKARIERFLGLLRRHPRNASTIIQLHSCLSDLLQQLMDGNFCDTSHLEGDIRVFEDLIQALYREQQMFSINQPIVFVRTLQRIWEYEDQGYIWRSSLINDLAIRALLETAQYSKICKAPTITAIKDMFVAAKQENKRVLIDAILNALNNAPEIDTLLEIWEKGISAVVGESEMRLSIVETAIVDMCINDMLITSKRHWALITRCIKSAFASPLFNCGKLREAVWEKISISHGQILVAYIRFFRALASADNADTSLYIEYLVVLLKERKCLHMDAQLAIYEAIDHLKKRSTLNVYKEPFFRVFSSDWNPLQKDHVTR